MSIVSGLIIAAMSCFCSADASSSPEKSSTIFFPSSAATIFSYRAVGSARINSFTGTPYQVASTPVRGPYNCDVSNPLSIVGSGEALTWRWVDGRVETLFPVEVMNCADIVWQP